MNNSRLAVTIEYALWTSSLVALMVFFGGRQISADVAHDAITSFRAKTVEDHPELVAPQPDTAIWSPERIIAYDPQVAQSEAAALLHIPKLALIAPVQHGTDNRTLDSFVGHSSYGAGFGEGGNLVLAAHRDGYFRELGKLAADDVIKLETHSATWKYRVTAAQIVEPEDVSVMQPTSRTSLTLITCYPFYFLGPAPKRYVVTAELLKGGS